MRAFLKSLNKEKKEILGNYKFSQREKEEEAGVSKQVVIAYEQQQRDRRGVLVGSFCFVIIAATLGPFYYAVREDLEHRIVKQTEPRQGIAKTEPRYNPEQEANPEPNQANTPSELVNAGIKALEEAFERGTPLQVWTPSKYVGTSHEDLYYQTLKEFWEFGQRVGGQNKIISIEESTAFSSPKIRRLLQIRDPTIYERLSAQAVLERFLTSGKEIMYDIYFNEKNNELCLFELLHNRDLVSRCLFNIRAQQASPDDYVIVKQFIVDEPGWLVDKEKKGDQRFHIHQFLNHQLDLHQAGRGDQLMPFVIERMLEYPFTHTSDAYVSIFDMNFHNKRFLFIGSMHNHNWGRGESQGDLDISHYNFQFVVIYDDAARSLRTSHLFKGRTLGGRPLSVDRNALHTWFLQHPGNQEPAWRIEPPEFTRPDRQYRYTVRAGFDYGIEYVVFAAGNDLLSVEHMQHAPPEIELTKEFSQPVTELYLLPQQGRFKLINFNYH